MIRWNSAKNERLKRERGVSFEEILQSELVGVVNHKTRKNQKLMLFRYAGYIWVVPYVAGGKDVFLKTLFKSRKHLRLVQRGDFYEEKQTY